MANMRTVIGLILVTMCVSSAMCQMSVRDCLRTAIADPSLVSPNCANATLIVGQMIGDLRTSESILDRVCSDDCVRSVSRVLNERCGVSFVDLYCSQDEDGYCITGEARVEQRVQNVLTACTGTNCTNTNCSAAVQNLSCCDQSLSDLNQVTDGTEFNLVSFLEEFECSQSDAPSRCRNGGMAVFAMPAALLAALTVALVPAF